MAGKTIKLSINRVYKIRNAQGLFSSGGASPTFSDKGKEWSNIGAIKNHLNMIKHQDIYRDCEVVTYEVTYTETNTQMVFGVLEEQRRAAQLKVAEQKQQQDMAKRQQDWETYQQLKQKYRFE